VNTPGRILVADDEPSFRKLLARLLESQGHSVEQAADASEALTLLSVSVFDLVVADINMPGNDGLPLLHNQDAVPVLIVTGDPTVETAVAALRGAAVDYLSKPVSPERLVSRVADGVARGRTLRTLRTTEERLSSQLEFVTSLAESLQVAGITAARSTGERPLPEAVSQLLSRREREVLSMFRMTPRIVDVSERLHISPHTVKNHLKSIFRKLKVSSQVELLARLAEEVRHERHGRGR
jgi:DNA-binding NarL/FixJ family response regulator